MNNWEPRDTTLLALNMLAESAESVKVNTTTRHRATVRLGLVARAREMFVQVDDGAELGLAEITLVGAAVPRSIGGDILRRAVSTGQEARGDDIAPVKLADVAIDCMSVDP